MLDRVSVSLACATIIAVLAKIAFLYKSANETWFDSKLDFEVIYIALTAFFMIFLRGKMMHDDSTYFKELDDGTTFKKTPAERGRVKFGLFLGYLSWMCWAPAVYFLERPRAFSAWMFVAILFASLWLLSDIFARDSAVASNEAKKRKWFLFINAAYLILLLAMYGRLMPPVLIAAALVLVLLTDWIRGDSFDPFAPPPSTT